MGEEVSEPWYRCVRCRAMFKLKNLIIRHLIAHKVHRFEGDGDTKCAQDWERVRVEGGTIVKVDLPPVEMTSDKRLEGLLIHAQQQTNWGVDVVDVKNPSAPSSSCPASSTMTLVTLTLPQDQYTVGGPFDPIISQTFFTQDKLDEQEDELVIATDTAFPSTEDCYPCRYCSAPFAHSRSRAVHEAKIHNDEIDGYCCQICNRNFPTISSVQDHYRCTHKVTPPVKKAWKSWKTHGGHIADHVSQQTHDADPILTRVEESDSKSSAAVITSNNSGGTGDRDPTTLQLHYDSFYFHSETGPIVAVQQPITPPPPAPKSRHSSEQEQTDTTTITPVKMKKSGGETSTKGKCPPKKSNRDKTRVKAAVCPKLPKDSPFRYQRLKCHKCSSRFRTQWELILHVGQVHFIFTCEFCARVFRDKGEMVRHQYTYHNTELGYYQCHFCRRNFGSPRIVQEHVHSDHEGERVPSTSVVLKWRRA